MKSFFKVVLVPGLGLLLVVLALIWCGRELRLVFFGEHTEARVVAMLLVRSTGTDLMRSTVTDITMQTPDGRRVFARFKDDQAIEGWVDLSGTVSSSPDRTGEMAGLQQMKPDWQQMVTQASKGDASVLRGILKREGRRSGDPDRIVAIGRTDRVEGWFGLADLPEGFDVDHGGLVPKGPAMTSGLGWIQISARFDRSDLAALDASRGELMKDYRYVKEGYDVQTTKRDFYLYAEPRSTEFRPVFQYSAGGRIITQISHIGRYGGPTLALQLFGPADVYFDPKKPEDSVLLAHVGPLEGRFLDWFSRVCEGLFGQWGGPAVVAFVGVCFLIAGLVHASLLFFPSRHLGTYVDPTAAGKREGG
ncbi:MAG: hypothetical protein SFU85_12565 [Candidatus Methylacidiphilales bacterium]|nr:hypothetical protein [Candidatus Methylacidiphilales bacterium]